MTGFINFAVRISICTMGIYIQAGRWKKYVSLAVTVTACAILAMIIHTSLQNTSGELNRFNNVFISYSLAFSAVSILLLLLNMRIVRISVVDIAACLAMASLLIAYKFNKEATSDLKIYFILILFLLYTGFRILLSVNGKWASAILFLILLYFGSNEAYKGILQILGKEISNHNLFACTGSFMNPGPFGGYLAVICSILVAYVIDRYNLIEGIIYKIKKRKCITILRGSCLLMFFAACASTVAILVVLPATMSRAAILAFAVSIVVKVACRPKIVSWLITFFRKYHWKAVILAVMTFFVLAGFAFGAYSMKRHSADGRILMNKISLQIMADNPLLGAGLGNFTGAYGEKQAEYFESGKGSEIEKMIADCPQYGFNEYLQLGAEAGIPTFVLFITLIILSLWVLFRRNSIWTYGLLTLSIFAFFSYPLSLMPFIILLVILPAMAGSYSKRQNSDKKRYGFAGIAVGMVFLFILVALSLVVVSYRPWYNNKIEVTKKWKEAERWYNQEYYDSVLEDYPPMLDDMFHDYTFLFEYGHALNKKGLYEESNSILAMGAALSCDPMFYNIIGNNYKELKEYEKAEQAYLHAFYMVPNRLYPLYLLAKLYYEEGDNDKFREAAEKVLSFNPKVESANTRDLRQEIREKLNSLQSLP